MRNFGQKMRLMIGRFVVNRVNDAGGLQIVQVDGLDGETRDGVERIQNFGHSGNPPAGAIGAGVSVMGSRDHLIVVACDHPDHRVKNLAPGESALYGAFGNLLKMDKDGNVVINANKLILNVQSVENNAANTTHSGNVAVSGVLASAKGDVDQHTHNDAENRITSTPNGGGA